MRTNKRKEDFIKIFSLNLRKAIEPAVQDFDSLREIRLRAEAPIVLRYGGRDLYITKEFRLTERLSEGMLIPAAELKETMEYISNYSLYAYEDEIRKGYLTIAGGHRVGVAGKIVCEKDEIRCMKYISFLCIRLAHEVRGVSDSLLRFLFSEGRFLDTLILSPPCAGKTTLLRDIIRNLSNGTKEHPSGYQIGVVDERSELAACYMGIPQNDLGFRTDVYDCCPKPAGIRMLLRSMAPQIIAVDEIATADDLDAVKAAFGCGCNIVATVHAESLEELQQKELWKQILADKLFRRYVVLGGRFGVGGKTVYDENGRKLS